MNKRNGLPGADAADVFKQKIGRTNMQELEKILEEIGEESFEQFGIGVISLRKVEKIIRKHINDGWIPVEERLPEVPDDIEDEYCPEFNVTIKGASRATTLKYSPDGTWFDDSGQVYVVIAWQPLPEPYRPERSKDGQAD